MGDESRDVSESNKKVIFLWLSSCHLLYKSVVVRFYRHLNFNVQPEKKKFKWKCEQFNDFLRRTLSANCVQTDDYSKWYRITYFTNIFTNSMTNIQRIVHILFIKKQIKSIKVTALRDTLSYYVYRFPLMKSGPIYSKPSLLSIDTMLSVNRER